MLEIPWRWMLGRLTHEPQLMFMMQVVLLAHALLMVEASGRLQLVVVPYFLLGGTVVVGGVGGGDEAPVFGFVGGVFDELETLASGFVPVSWAALFDVEAAEEAV